MSMRISLPIFLWSAFATIGGAAAGDEFRELVGAPLFDLAKRGDAKTHPALTFRELEALPATLGDARVALVIVATDQGNLAKLVLSPGFRRTKEGDGDGVLVPILIVERFETIDARDRRSSKARGKETTLYHGFELDLDAGQIVPPGLGGDLVFRTDGPSGPRVVALGKGQLMTFETMLPATSAAPGRRSAGRTILAADFAGRYQLVADGQWSGSLELAVDASGNVSGHFRSDKNGTVYAVAGTVAVDSPQKINFTIQFPRSRQTFEGLLWSDGKDVIAGTLTMLEHAYSFVAIREGASLLPDDLELGSSRAAGSSSRTSIKKRRLVVNLGPEPDRFQVDGVFKTPIELERTMAQLIKADPTAEVVLRIGNSVPFERVRSTVRTLRGVGLASIRLSLGESDDGAAAP